MTTIRDPRGAKDLRVIAHSVHHPLRGAIPPTHGIHHAARVVMILMCGDRVRATITRHRAVHATKMPRHRAVHATMTRHRAVRAMMMPRRRAPCGPAMRPHAVLLLKMRIRVAPERAIPLGDRVRATRTIPHDDRQRIGVMNVMARRDDRVPAMRTIPPESARGLRARQDGRGPIPREKTLMFHGVPVRGMAMTMDRHVRAAMTPAVAGADRAMILTMSRVAVPARKMARPDVRAMAMTMAPRVRAAMTLAVAEADRAMPMGRNRVAARARIMMHPAQRATATTMDHDGGRARPWMMDPAEAVTRSMAASGAMRRGSAAAS